MNPSMIDMEGCSKINIKLDTVIQKAEETNELEEAGKHYGSTETNYNGYKNGPSGRFYQVLLSALVSLCVVGSGTIVAFPSVIIPDVQDGHSTLYQGAISLSDLEKDLMGSVVYLGAFLGIWAAGTSSGRVGRVVVLRALGALGTVFWLGVALAPNTEVCLLFRFLSGAVYGSTTVTAIAYIVEVADDKIRSFLPLFTSFSISLGQTLCVLPAYWLHYYWVAIINSVYPACFFFLAVFLLPESPTVLVQKDKESKTHKLLSRLREPKADVTAEIEVYRHLNATVRDSNPWLCLLQRDVLKKIFIVLGVFVLQMFSGYTVFVALTSCVVQDSGGHLPPRRSTIMVQSAMLVGNMFGMLMVTRIGRRGSLMLSHVIMGASIAGLATYTHVNSHAATLAQTPNGVITAYENDSDCLITINTADTANYSALIYNVHDAKDCISVINSAGLDNSYLNEENRMAADSSRTIGFDVKMIKRKTTNITETINDNNVDIVRQIIMNVLVISDNLKMFDNTANRSIDVPVTLPLENDKKKSEQENYSFSSPETWKPLVCILLAQFGCGIGVQITPFALASEYFPTTIRMQASTVCVSVGMALGALSLSLYSPLQQLLSQQGLLFLYAGTSFLALPYSYFVVLETVGKGVG